jgi:alpha-amylase
MPFINLCFRIHQPYSLKAYSTLDVQKTHFYFDEEKTIQQLDELAALCLLPALKLLLKLAEQHKNKFRVSFSISGIMLEQLEKHRPDVLSLLKKLVKNGTAELMGETYSNSLASLYSDREFQRQAEQHSSIVYRLFKTKPSVFRNTELIYNSRIAMQVEQMGFKGMVCEAVDRILQQHTRNKLYRPSANSNFPLMLRNHRMSDDIAFNFANENWNEYPLTAEKFAGWVHAHDKETELINLFFDLQTFGMHKPAASGIFDFLEQLPGKIMADERWLFATPSEILEQCKPCNIYDVKETISWEDKAEECCVWCNNTMQNNTLHKVFKMEHTVKMSKDEAILKTWERLQCADYFYYMSNSKRRPGDSYQLVNPYSSADDAYQNFKNIITDFEIQIILKSINDYKSKKSFLLTSLLY